MHRFMLLAAALITLVGCATAEPVTEPAKPQKRQLPPAPEGYIYVKCRENICLDYKTGQFFGFTENAKDGVYLVWKLSGRDSI